ncbi:hypothetical protein [Clostridium thermobutyricum]|uniref:hypothetical protein n=1 Tax=Clostridium thermobutyricum TaxID=29372 RepID=UPI0018ABE3EE|nr:hypothetical protein [Clostridium thermobutyricum]
MNSTEREIYDKYAYKKTHIYLVYEEFERRVNSTENEYDGLKKGECRFDYSSWEKRLNLTHKVMINSIKMLVKEEYIEQRVRGKKGTQSTYFLTRFLEQNWEQNKEQNWEQKKDSNINTLDNIKEQKEERNLEQKKVQSSIYNNLNIKSNINNIYYSSSEVEKELLENNKEIDEEEIIKNRILNNYSKSLIEKELLKLKNSKLNKLELLKELENNLKFISSNKNIKNKIKKGTQSTYFLTRFNSEFDQQKKQQNYQQKEQQNKTSNINALEDICQQNYQQKDKQKTVHSSIYNNLDIISNNNINSSLELKNNSNKQNKTNKKVSEEEINKIWNMYPKKQGKGYAIKKIPNLIKKYGIEQMERCIKRYIEYVENERKTGFKDLQYKNGQTFFNSGYMDYLDENFEEIQKEKSEKENNLILPRKEDDLSF